LPIRACSGLALYIGFMLLGNTHDKTDGRQLPIGVCDDQIALRFVADDDISFPLGLRESALARLRHAKEY
jgi:hypothetical protein